MCADLDAAHAALRGEGNEVGAQLGEIAAANAVSLLGEHDDGAARGGLVGERGELRDIGQLLLGHAAQRLELGGLATSPAASTARPDIQHVEAL
jgi:hypothetical protein